MQNQKIIEELGFSSKEAKVYLATLSMGEVHVSDIAKKVKLPRTSVQIIAEKLYKHGLMNFYTMKRYKYWSAENPERLLSKIQRKAEAMKEALPRLLALKRESWGKRKPNDTTESLGLFHVLADASLQPVLVVNEQVQIEYVNAAWEKQFGYTLEEIQGQNPSILRSGRTPLEIYDSMWTALKAEKMFQTDQIIDKRKDGTLFNLLTTIFPVRHKGILYYIQILEDITGRNKLIT